MYHTKRGMCDRYVEEIWVIGYVKLKKPFCPVLLCRNLILSVFQLFYIYRRKRCSVIPGTNKNATTTKLRFTLKIHRKLIVWMGCAIWSEKSNKEIARFIV